VTTRIGSVAARNAIKNELLDAGAIIRLWLAKFSQRAVSAAKSANNPNITALHFSFKRAYAPLQKEGGLDKSNSTGGVSISNNEILRLRMSARGGRITA
jgi:hypothetical protein